VFGTGDAYITEQTARGSAAYVEDIEEVFLSGVSHWSMLDDPKRVNDAIEGFLKRRGL
jgi:pimeloyl-ACP methyl ester carboxylesterase